MEQPIIPPYMLVPVGSSSNQVISTKPPKYYQCDKNGYPPWCTHCQSLKLSRSHHSKQVGRCILRFDHYCAWIGCVIARNNYRLFLQYVGWFNLLLLWYWLTIAVFIRTIGMLNGNVIVGFILSCLGWMMTLGLFISHIYYMSNNKTSIETLDAERGKRKKHKMMVTNDEIEHARIEYNRKYFCYYNQQDKFRYVVELTADEFAKCWKKRSFWINAREFLGSDIIFWLFPWGSYFPDLRKREASSFQSYGQSYDLENIIGPYKEVLSSSAIDLIENRITQGNYVTKFLAYGDNLDINM